MKTSYVS